MGLRVLYLIQSKELDEQRRKTVSNLVWVLWGRFLKASKKGVNFTTRPPAIDSDRARPLSGGSVIQ
eukprot:2177719-Pleurochrysis_carterae.AAC.1